MKEGGFLCEMKEMVPAQTPRFPEKKYVRILMDLRFSLVILMGPRIGYFSL